jgi:hypothetical protein
MLVICLCCAVCPVQDFFFHKAGVSNGGNRYSTVLAYLSDIEEGGETVRAVLCCGVRWRMGWETGHTGNEPSLTLPRHCMLKADASSRNSRSSSTHK